jgi:cardiolipin synthase
VRLAQAAARPYCRLLARNGIRVFRYLPAMLHGKTMLIDDELSLVGSANADIRSFRLNFELGALIRCREFAESLAERFRADQAQSDELTAEEASAASVPTRFADGVARLLSPLL